MKVGPEEFDCTDRALINFATPIAAKIPQTGEDPVVIAASATEYIQAPNLLITPSCAQTYRLEMVNGDPLPEYLAIDE